MEENVDMEDIADYKEKGLVHIFILQEIQEETMNLIVGIRQESNDLKIR